ncbi:MAG: dynamin family protein [Ardenticatenales bacterium]|nr:dynamin family protein [Ardenticatenales bacterium]
MMTQPTGPGWLDPRMAASVAEIRALLADLADALDGTVERPDGIRRVRQAAEDLSSLLLVVVVGEFNAGKSALINTLLGGPYLAEGVTPTTAEVQWLVFGDAAEARVAGDVLWRPLPAPRLRELAIIDTPGTNAVLREHERLTREFVPRADIVVFVTSADRPFPESERDLMSLIHAWRRRTVVVVNKIDLVRTDAERAEILEFVAAQVQNLIGEPVPVLAVSARRAREAHALGQTDADWAVFDAWLTEHLTAEEGLRLKLSSPLALAERVAADALAEIGARQAVLTADGEMLAAIDVEAAASEQALRREHAGRLDTIDARIQGLRERGESFLDEHMRLAHIRALLDREALKRAFDEEVIGATPTHVAADINAEIDWLVEQEEQRWRSLRVRLAETATSGRLETLALEAGPGFASRRQALLGTIGRQAATVLAAFDPDAEAARLESTVREALAHTALLEVGALGLGLAIVSLSVFDATGIVAGSALGMIGLAVLPYRRRKAALAMRERLAELRAELRTRLTDTFDTELAAFDGRLNALLEPYRTFVVAERSRLDVVGHRLTAIGDEVGRLSKSVGAR